MTFFFGLANSNMGENNSEYSFKSAQTESTVARLYSHGKSKFQSTCSDLPWYHSFNNALCKVEQAIFAISLIINDSCRNFTVRFLQNHPTLVLLLLKVSNIIGKLPFCYRLGNWLHFRLKTIYN